MKKKLLFIAVSVLLISEIYLGCEIVFPALQSFLTRNNEVDANILVIEGWLSFNDLRLAASEAKKKEYDYVITSGLESVPEYYGMHRNGLLIFDIPDTLTDIRKIEVTARSNDNRAADFNVLVNGTVSGTFSVKKYRKQCRIDWNGTRVNSVAVEFISDTISVLLIKNIILDNLHIPFLNNTEYIIKNLEESHKIINDFSSNSELAAKRLLAFGVDSTRLFTAAAEKVKINRTLSSAVAVNNWLKKKNIPVVGINIISSGTHSRRTWMTYKNVLAGETKVGIVALPGSKKEGKDGRYIKTARETIAFLYYSLVLAFH
ncbi:MAG TPA: hypothetical protein VK213_11830 [Bacteroidales bacterium]|nr:hypothetical protein [Bacteroidales bacterium]